MPSELGELDVRGTEVLDEDFRDIVSALARRQVGWDGVKHSEVRSQLRPLRRTVADRLSTSRSRRLERTAQGSTAASGSGALR